MLNFLYELRVFSLQKMKRKEDNCIPMKEKDKSKSVFKLAEYTYIFTNLYLRFSDLARVTGNK
jgi:hypothetical protein